MALQIKYLKLCLPFIPDFMLTFRHVDVGFNNGGLHVGAYEVDDLIVVFDFLEVVGVVIVCVIVRVNVDDSFDASFLVNFK